MLSLWPSSTWRWDPHKNGHGRLPLLFGERAGVRGNMRPPCGLRDPNNKLARSAPSPLLGEGWGEREHATSLWAEGALQKYWRGRLPLLFGERAGVRGTCDSGGGSVHLTFCTSLSAASPVNVPGGLAASPLATPAPGQENRRFAVPSAYSFRLSGRARPCASPRPYGNASAIFSRIHAPSSFSAV